MKRINKGTSIFVLAIVSAGAIGASIFIGPTPWEEVTTTIIQDLRLPRAILAFLVGASLGTAGVVFQGIFRNPLADPFVVGVSGGAGLGAVVAIVFGVQMTLLGLGASSLFAFVGALGAAFLAYQISNIRGRVPVGSLLLSGFAIGAFTGAVVSILLILNSRNWNEVIAWLMGNMNHADPWNRVWVVLPFFIISFGIALSKARHLNLLLFGEEEAQTLGVDSEGTKLVLLFAGSIAAAAAVAMCGIIGFVGLIVPHIVRTLVGPDHRTLLPTTFLAGGFLLTIADIASRLFSPDTPLPIGAVTALCGAPFFLYLLRRKSIRF
ncbi:MAG: iron chelate uptake ABC transporter family permease subunit [Planctomycetota bacterium]|nr:iron chelate uptake ABC transporter family permease subunit [Planctomycetota bacterium]